MPRAAFAMDWGATSDTASTLKTAVHHTAPRRNECDKKTVLLDMIVWSADPGVALNQSHHSGDGRARDPAYSPVGNGTQNKRRIATKGDPRIGGRAIRLRPLSAVSVS